jgi:hypothetical protein
MEQRLVSVMHRILSGELWIMGGDLDNVIKDMTPEEKTKYAKLIHETVGHQIRGQEPQKYLPPTDPRYCDNVVNLLDLARSQWEHL